MRTLLLCTLWLVRIFARIDDTIHEPTAWNVVWLCETMWEHSYINQVLKSPTLQVNQTFLDPVYNEDIINLPNLILIFRYGFISTFSDELEKIGRRNVVAFVIGDERPWLEEANKYPESHSIYQLTFHVGYFTNAARIIPQEVHVPLALQHTVAGLPFANILASTPAFQDRKYFFSFSSDHITEIRDNFVHKVLAHNFSRPIFLRYSGKISKTFGKVHGVVNDGKFEAEDFHLLMQNSMFALAPEGDVPETFRFYEILENGAIPVIMTSTFLSYYRHFLPCSISRNILMSHDPGHALHQVQAHIKDSENMARFEERRRELISAFNDWRDDYQADMRRRIAQVFAGNHSGPQLPLEQMYNKWEWESCYNMHDKNTEHSESSVFHMTVLLCVLCLAFGFLAGFRLARLRLKT